MPPRPVQAGIPHGLQPQRPIGTPIARIPSPAAVPVARPISSHDEPLTLVEEMDDLVSDTATPSASKIKFGPDVAHKKHEWKRTPAVTGRGACRVKSFHAKYSDQGIEHIDDAINEWLDAHAEVEVKFVTTSVHVFEGKIREPAIVMNVWY
jgi:hypothetical protein